MSFSPSEALDQSSLLLKSHLVVYICYKLLRLQLKIILRPEVLSPVAAVLVTPFLSFPALKKVNPLVDLKFPAQSEISSITSQSPISFSSVKSRQFCHIMGPNLRMI